MSPDMFSVIFPRKKVFLAELALVRFDVEVNAFPVINQRRIRFES